MELARPRRPREPTTDPDATDAESRIEQLARHAPDRQCHLLQRLVRRLDPAGARSRQPVGRGQTRKAKHLDRCVLSFAAIDLAVQDCLAHDIYADGLIVEYRPRRATTLFGPLVQGAAALLSGPWVRRQPFDRCRQRAVGRRLAGRSATRRHPRQRRQAVKGADPRGPPEAESQGQTRRV